MKKGNFKSLSFLLLAIFILFSVAPDQGRAGRRGPDPSELKTVTGIIVQNSPGSFILRNDKSGKEEKYNTGRETRYEPGDFRSRDGDRVKVTYYMKDVRGERLAAVTGLGMLNPNPKRKEPKNPTVGTVMDVGKKFYQIFIPEINQNKRFDTARGIRYTPSGWKPAVNEKVRISFELVPSRWGNYYVYSIKSFELVK